MLSPARAADRFDRLLLGVVLVVAVVLALPGFGDASIQFPDADRLLMDGVFLRDAAIDRPWADPFGYAERYYAQYPALSIGYRPPLFAAGEAVLMLVLGPHAWCGRLAALLFWLTGLAAFFALVRRAYDGRVAFLAAALLATTPFVVPWSRLPMTELPALAATLWATNAFHKHLKTGDGRALVAAALFVGLAGWARQPAACVGAAFALRLVLRGGLRATFGRRATWAALAVAVVVLAPLVAMTLKFAGMNLAHSVGTSARVDAARGGPFDGLLLRLSWDNLRIYLKTLVDAHLTAPAAALALLGVVVAAVRRDREALLFACVVVVTYATFTALNAKDDRYPIFWIPSFCVFAALPFAAARAPALRAAAGVVLLAVASHQGVRAFGAADSYATGYDVAARHVLARSESPVVFFDGYNNGWFTSFMRLLDPARSMFVLRADKLLSSSAVSPKWATETHAATAEDVLALFDRYGVEYVVVERENRNRISIHDVLRRVLKEGPFDLEATVPIATNRKPLVGQSLEVYRYRDRKEPAADSLELRLPIVGRTLKVPFRRPEDVDRRPTSRR